jgi:hypothetical protein
MKLIRTLSQNCLKRIMRQASLYKAEEVLGGTPRRRNMRRCHWAQCGAIISTPFRRNSPSSGSLS